MQLKSIAAAAAFVLAAAGAQAQSSTNLGAIAVGSTATFSFLQNADFLDFDVLFSLAGFGNASSGASASATTMTFTVNPNLSVNVGSTQSPLTVVGNLYNSSGNLVSFDSNMADGFAFSALTAGSQYRLNLSSAPVQGATFVAGGGAIAVTTAVPEPETYAMFLAGLGAIGFMSRRRKSA